MKHPFWLLLRVVGRKAFLAFFLVTFFVVAILSATNVVSKYALKSYTEDQIDRIKWDAIAYQAAPVPEVALAKEDISAITGVNSVVDVGSMKLGLGTFIHVDVEHERTQIPWFMMLASEDPSLLPPDIRPEDGETVTALVGSQTMVGSYMNRLISGNTIGVFHENPFEPGEPAKLFEARIERISNPERLEIVKYFLDEFGSATFIPDGSLFVVTPKETFDRELPGITRLIYDLSKPQPILGGEDGAGQTEPSEENMGAMLIQEFMHLIHVDRGQLVTGWDLDSSYRRASSLVAEIQSAATAVSFDSFVNSELVATLEKMAQVSQLIGLLTILVSFPVLWLTWLFASSLANLIILNQRRLIGLLRLRGVSYASVRKALLAAIGAAGILGGFSGTLVGTLLPYMLYRIYGVEIPLRLLFTTIQEPWVLVTFILLGTGFGLAAGMRVTNYMEKITPLEASRRVASSEEQEFRYEFTKFQLLCLILGGAKMFAWMTGYMPQTASLGAVDNILNFVGASAFLYGFAAFIVSKRDRLGAVLGVVVGPLAKDLKWFAVRSMLVRPHRVMIVILMSALTFGVVVYPEITSRSFYDKTVRALRLNLGSDIAIRFDAFSLAEGEVSQKPIGQYIEVVGEKLARAEEQIRSIEAIRDVSALYQFSIPGSFYIAGQNYLQLYLMERPDEFLRNIYYEDELSVEMPFREQLERMGKEEILVSQGFRASYDANGSDRLSLGRGDGGEDIEVTVAGTIRLLPGLSQLMMQDRESFTSASIEFINSISRTQPYVVGRLDADNIPKVEGLLTNAILHVGANGAPGAVLDELVRFRDEGLIPAFADIYTEATQRERLSSDMFVYMALEDIKVFMVGGILVAIAGLMAISMVNFMERKRTFALLRLRGAPPRKLRRVILADLVGPLLVGALIGVPVGILTGYGLTNAIFALPRAASILQILPVHLTLSWLVGAIVFGLLAVFLVSSLLLSRWEFQKTAREAIGD